MSELSIFELEPYYDENTNVNTGVLWDDEICTLLGKLKEGQTLNLEQINIVFRALLRERMWCRLYSKEKHIFLDTGYDFYVHCSCEELTDEQIDMIQSYGIYVQER